MSIETKKFNNGHVASSRRIIVGAPPVPSIVEPPETSPALDAAAARLARIISESASGGKRLVLFGDFDVDGTASSAIMFQFVRMCGVERVEPFVSKRVDGYGLTEKAITRLQERITDFSQVIVVLMDLGISSTAEAARLVALGAEVMIIDHHVPKPTARAEWEALEVAYPGRAYAFDPVFCDSPEDRYFSCLSAAGLTFKLCMRILALDFEGLAGRALSKERVTIVPGGKSVPIDAVVNNMAKCCAIAQAADCMPFAIGSNVSAAWWLAKDFESQGPLLAGVEILYERTNTASRIAWVIGPILNAAGRLEDAHAAFDLLIETDEEKARAKLKAMEAVRERVRKMTGVANGRLEDDLFTHSGVAVLVGDPERIKAGVIGIAAARASDTFKAPAIYMCPEDDGKNGVVFKGSMRRGETNFSCEEWILSLKEAGIVSAGGGHPAAAGATVPESRMEELLKSAEACRYDLEIPPIYRVTAAGAKGYVDAVVPTLPFGRGHESATLAVSGLLQSIRGLMTAKDGEPRVWAYAIRVADPETVEGVEIKVMASDVTPSQRELFERLAKERNLNAPVEVVTQVHDGFKHGSRYPRAELRAVASTPVGEKVDADDKDAQHVSESGRQVSVRFLSASEFSKIFMAGRVDFEEATSEWSAGGEEPDVEQLLKGNDRRVVVEIDWTPSLHRRAFTLKKPPKWELDEALGERKAKALSDLHGGRWHDRMKVYVITAATVENLVDGDRLVGEDWRFILSSAATAHLDELRREAAIVAERKLDVRPFEVPFLREGKKPLGFQYADVRLYMERPFAICHNDMGTGKTFEAAIWGILRHVGGRLDSEREIVLPEEAVAENLPILVVTLKGVMGQFADEIEAFLDVKAARVATGEIREFLAGIGEATSAAASPQADGGKKFVPLAEVSDRAKDGFKKMVIDGHAFVVTTYDCVGRNPWLVAGYRWGGVVFDEAHELKTVGVNKTNALLGREIDGAPLRGAPVLVLSGTITKNRPADWFVWVRLTGADGGIYTAGGADSAKTRFDMRFDALTFERIKTRSGKEFTKTIRGTPENGDELKRVMFPFVVRRLKTELSEFPTIGVNLLRQPSAGLYFDVIASLEGLRELAPANRALLEKYKLLGKDGIPATEAVEVDKGETAAQQEAEDGVSAVDAESLAGKLALISSLDKATTILDTLRRLGWVDKDGKADEPFVVIGMHRSATMEIAARLGAAGIDHFLMMQADSAEKRRAKSAAFSRGERMAFVTTYGVGGTGLNLTRARRILLAGLPYTETLLSQARDRVHRIGQTKNVEAVILIQSASIDEAIWWLVSQKGKANFATAGVDRVKKGELPSWAKGSIADQAKSGSGGAGYHAPSPRRRSGSKDNGNEGLAEAINSSGVGFGFSKTGRR